MKAHELEVGNNKTRTRVGRGIAAGRGKTAGRGTKGQNARAGGKRRPGFEGGQTPFLQRIPKKRGFTSHRQAKETVYTGQLDALGDQIDHRVLFDAGLTTSLYNDVKLVVNGEVSKKHTVLLDAASAQAVVALEKAGGSFTITASPNREAKKRDESSK